MSVAYCKVPYRKLKTPLKVNGNLNLHLLNTQLWNGQCYQQHICRATTFFKLRLGLFLTENGSENEGKSEIDFRESKTKGKIME